MLTVQRISEVNIFFKFCIKLGYQYTKDLSWKCLKLCDAQIKSCSDEYEIVDKAHGNLEMTFAGTFNHFCPKGADPKSTTHYPNTSFI